MRILIFILFALMCSLVTNAHPVPTPGYSQEEIAGSPDNNEDTLQDDYMFKNSMPDDVRANYDPPNNKGESDIILDFRNNHNYFQGDNNADTLTDKNEGNGEFSYGNNDQGNVSDGIGGADHTPDDKENEYNTPEESNHNLPNDGSYLYPDDSESEYNVPGHSGESEDKLLVKNEGEDQILEDVVTSSPNNNYGDDKLADDKENDSNNSNISELPDDNVDQSYISDGIEGVLSIPDDKENENGTPDESHNIPDVNDGSYYNPDDNKSEDNAPDYDVESENGLPENNEGSDSILEDVVTSSPNDYYGDDRLTDSNKDDSNKPNNNNNNVDIMTDENEDISKLPDDNADQSNISGGVEGVHNIPDDKQNENSTPDESHNLHDVNDDSHYNHDDDKSEDNAPSHDGKPEDGLPENNILEDVVTSSPNDSYGDDKLTDDNDNGDDGYKTNNNNVDTLTDTNKNDGKLSDGLKGAENIPETKENENNTPEETKSLPISNNGNYYNFDHNKSEDNAPGHNAKHEDKLTGNNEGEDKILGDVVTSLPIISDEDDKLPDNSEVNVNNPNNTDVDTIISDDNKNDRNLPVNADCGCDTLSGIEGEDAYLANDNAPYEDVNTEESLADKTKSEDNIADDVVTSPPSENCGDDKSINKTDNTYEPCNKKPDLIKPDHNVSGNNLTENTDCGCVAPAENKIENKTQENKLTTNHNLPNAHDDEAHNITPFEYDHKTEHANKKGDNLVITIYDK